MQVEIKESSCVHMVEISHYNHNYYTLPFTVNGCDTVYSECDEFLNTQITSVGHMFEGKYIPKYWLHMNSHRESFIFDSSALAAKNRWT